MNERQELFQVWVESSEESGVSLRFEATSVIKSKSTDELNNTLFLFYQDFHESTPALRVKLSCAITAATVE